MEAEELYQIVKDLPQYGDEALWPSAFEPEYSSKSNEHYEWRVANGGQTVEPEIVASMFVANLVEFLGKLHAPIVIDFSKRDGWSIFESPNEDAREIGKGPTLLHALVMAWKDGQ